MLCKPYFGVLNVIESRSWSLFFSWLILRFRRIHRSVISTPYIYSMHAYALALWSENKTTTFRPNKIRANQSSRILHACMHECSIVLSWSASYIICHRHQWPMLAYMLQIYDLEMLRSQLGELVGRLTNTVFLNYTIYMVIEHHIISFADILPVHVSKL